MRGERGDVHSPKHVGSEEELGLTSLTERVAYSTGNTIVYHAPTGDGTLCSTQFDRVVDREVLEPNYRPCRACFYVDELEE
jgi:hypothetical protein